MLNTFIKDSSTADVLDQGIDIATHKQRKYDLWRTVRRTYLGTTKGAAAGFTLGSARGGVEYIKLAYMLGSGDAIFALNKTAVAPLKQQTGQNNKLLLTAIAQQDLLCLENKGSNALSIGSVASQMALVLSKINS